MPYPRNPEREEILLDHYILGHTIKMTSFFTGIPAGSIGYYFSKFKKRPEYYMMRQNVEAPLKNRETSEEVVNNILNAQANILFLHNVVIPLFQEGKYADARDFLESMKILIEYYKEFNQLLTSATPEEREKANQSIANAFLEFIKVIGSAQRPVIIPNKEEKLTEAPVVSPRETQKEAPKVAQQNNPKFSDISSMIKYYIQEEFRTNPKNIDEIARIIESSPKRTKS